METDNEFRERILVEARTIWKGHRLYNELVDHCITIAIGSLLDGYGQRYGMTRKGVEEKVEKRRVIWFVWHKAVSQHGFAGEKELMCQLVRDEAFLPKGIVAKHEIAEGFADDLKVLIALYPAPDIADAQG